MKLQIQDQSYLVLQALEPDVRGVCEYICRRMGETDGREYRAVSIPSEQVTGELIRYLMEQVRRESFREFVNYATEAESVTVLMDCGFGPSLAERQEGERLSLPERLEMARLLLSHLVLADFPPYFLYAAMDRERIRVTAAMEFFFAFDLSDILSFASISFPMACRRLGNVLEELFSPELRRRAIPELETFLYDLKRGRFGDLLSIYEEMEAICRAYGGREEESLENRSAAFLFWERIKWVGRKLKALVKLGILLLVTGYLALSIYQFVQPEVQGTVYTSIGDLDLKE